MNAIKAKNKQAANEKLYTSPLQINPDKHSREIKRDVTPNGKRQI